VPTLRIDYYEVLGVSRRATPAEIRRAWQRCSRKLHPALNPGDEAAAEHFEVASKAYQVLSDAERRARYDGGQTEPARPAPEPVIEFEGFDFSGGTRRGGVGFREIFDEVMRPRSGPGSAGPQRGEDLEQSTRVSFQESLTGTQREIRLVRHDACDGCGGSGEVAQEPEPCLDCGGRGQLKARRGHMVFTKSCHRCDGSGRLDARPCPRCEGEGRRLRTDRLGIEIPAGVRDGSRVELPGAGNAGIRGGPAGDLTLVVHVESHPFYERRGDDLYCRVPVSMTEAALGAHIEVPTPTSSVTIEIPAGTQTGQRFRLRKRGVPHAGGKGRGDLYVEADVRVPRVVDDAARDLLREFALRQNESPRAGLDASLPGAGRSEEG